MNKHENPCTDLLKSLEEIYEKLSSSNDVKSQSDFSRLMGRSDGYFAKLRSAGIEPGLMPIMTLKKKIFERKCQKNEISLQTDVSSEQQNMDAELAKMIEMKVTSQGIKVDKRTESRRCKT